MIDVILRELRMRRQRLAGNRHLRICPSCRHLYGDCGQPSPQRCRCEWPIGDDPWPRYDHNTSAELCRCCGLELLKSGSRWSVWFCESCKNRVRRLNRDAGRCILPLGRHSLHANVSLTGKQARRPGEVMAFVAALHAIGDARKVLGRWAERVVDLNIEAMGLEVPPEGLLLGDYIGAICRRPPASKRRRFRDMTSFLIEMSNA